MFLLRATLFFSVKACRRLLSPIMQTLQHHLQKRRFKKSIREDVIISSPSVLIILLHPLVLRILSSHRFDYERVPAKASVFAQGKHFHGKALPAEVETVEARQRLVSGCKLYNVAPLPPQILAPVWTEVRDMAEATVDVAGGVDVYRAQLNDVRCRAISRYPDSLQSHA